CAADGQGLDAHTSRPHPRLGGGHRISGIGGPVPVSGWVCLGRARNGRALQSPGGNVKNRTAKVVAAVTTMAVTLAVTATSAMAQVPDPAPDGSMPGAALVTSMLGWLKWGALAAAVAGILGGGIAVGVGHFG